MHIENIRLNCHLFEKTEEQAKNTFIFRTASKPQQGTIWGATLECADQMFYSICMSKERPVDIFTGEDCAPVSWHKLNAGFMECEAGTIKPEHLVKEEFTHTHILNPNQY